MTSGARRLLATCAVALVACGSSPEPVYYALGPTSGRAEPGWARIVELRRPGLAGYLDRPDIVTRVVDHRLQIDDGRRWAEPLGDMIARVVAQNLSQRLPGSTVFTESSLSAVPDATVEMDIQRLDVGDDGRLTLIVQVAVERGRERGAATVRTFRLASGATGTGVAWFTSELSALLGDLADGIAAMLRAG